MQIDPSYSDVREDYSEVLYEVGRLEDSMRAARQLVTLDPYFGIGWNRILRAAMALDRRAEVEEAVRQMRAISPGNFIGKLGLLDYAVAYGRADEARAALAEIETRWPKDAVFAQTLLPWALGETGHRSVKLRAAIADAPPGEASRLFHRPAGHRRLKRLHRHSRSDTSAGTTSLTFMAASRWARRCCEIRGSRQWSCASVSRRIGARKAGPPDAGRSARQTSNAGWIRRAANEMNFFAELKRRNVYKVAVAYAVVGWLLVQVATQVLPLFESPNGWCGWWFWSRLDFQSRS